MIQLLNLNPKSEEEMLQLLVRVALQAQMEVYMPLINKIRKFGHWDIAEKRREHLLLSYADNPSKMLDDFFRGFVKDSLETRDGNVVQRLIQLFLAENTIVYPRPSNDVLFAVMVDGEPCLILAEIKYGPTWNNTSSLKGTHLTLLKSAKEISTNRGMRCMPVCAVLSANKPGNDDAKPIEGVTHLFGPHAWNLFTGYPSMYEKVPHFMAVNFSYYKPTILQAARIRYEELREELEMEGINDMREFLRAYKPAQTVIPYENVGQMLLENSFSPS